MTSDPSNTRQPSPRPPDTENQRVYADLATVLANAGPGADGRWVIATQEIAERLQTLDHTAAAVDRAIHDGCERELFRRTVLKRTRQKALGRSAVEAKRRTEEVQAIEVTDEFFVEQRTGRLTRAVANEPGTENIVLSFSGGGVRAALFHLGILLHLYHAKRLGNVTGIVSVSGGSILAAQFVKDWKLATSGETGFVTVSGRLVRFVRSDLRDRVLVPWLWSNVMPWRWMRNSRTARLELAYREHFGETTLGDLAPKNSPAFAFVATDSIKRERIVFTHDSILRLPLNSARSPTSPVIADARAARLSLAVAASSRFPPVFPRMHLDNEDLSLSYDHFKETLSVNDGGVTDNLGAEVLLEFLSSKRFEADTILVGDAERAQRTKPRDHSGADLAAQAAALTEAARKRLESVLGTKCRLIRLSERIPDQLGLSLAAQTDLAVFRTDLDAPSWQEIHALMLHGAEVAGAVDGPTPTEEARGHVRGTILKILEHAGGPDRLPQPDHEDLKTSYRLPLNRLLGHLSLVLTFVGVAILTAVFGLRGIMQPDSPSASGHQSGADKTRPQPPERAQNREPFRGPSKATVERDIPEATKTTINNAGEDELTVKIRKYIVDSRDSNSTEDAIRMLNKGVKELRLDDPSIADPDALEASALLYLALSNCYESQYSYDDAIAANDREFQLFQRIYGVDPRKEINKATLSIFGQSNDVSVADEIAANRLRWVFLTHAVKETKLNPADLQKVREAIGYAGESLKKSSAHRIARAQSWLVASLAYWLNGDLDLADFTANEALDVAGSPLPAGVETRPKREFFAFYYPIRAAIHAERKQTKNAWDALERAKPYLDAVPSHSRMVGYVQLLIARSAPSDAERLRALDEAIPNFKKDGCAYCRYDLACALSGKSELTRGAQSDAALLEARTLLLIVLNDSSMRNEPFEPEKDAIAKDPFLKPLSSHPDVRRAIDAFTWEPKELGRIPPQMVDATRLGLWYAGFPLKRARFSRLNGDDRAPSLTRP
jgi:predicted acylesterase/phospholipase RssA